MGFLLFLFRANSWVWGGGVGGGGGVFPALTVPLSACRLWSSWVENRVSTVSRSRVKLSSALTPERACFLLSAFQSKQTFETTRL